MKKLLFLMVVLTISNGVLSQNLNGYKYALVPSKFAFFKDKDKYQLNTLTKLFMQKYGFETYFETDTAPYDFTNNNCNKVYVDLVKDNNLFLTRLNVVLKDCNGKILFTSKQGSSKDKALNVAYNEALRAAFASFESLHHKYDQNIVMQVASTKEISAEPKAVVEETHQMMSAAETTPNQLYAQPIQNGFQLVNSEPKVVMKLYKTSVKDVYTALKDGLQGVLVTKNNQWFFEYYQNEKLISEKVDVKF